MGGELSVMVTFVPFTVTDNAVGFAGAAIPALDVLILLSVSVRLVLLNENVPVPP